MNNSNNDKDKRIAKNTLYLYIRMIFVLMVSLYTTRAIINALGIIDYGIYNVVAGFVSMFAFLNSSMTNTIQRFYNYELGNATGGNLNKIYITSIQIQFLLALVTVTILEIVGVWYINNKMVIPIDRLTSAIWVFHMSVVSLLLLILQIPYTSSVVAHERMGFYAVVSMVDVILKLAVAFSLPYLNSDRLIFYGLFMLIISITNFLLYYIYSKIHFEEILYKHIFHRQQFKDMLVFSWWNVFGAFAYTMQGQGLNMLMNLFFGPVVNAARGIAYQAQSALSGFTENISVAFKPQLVESYAKGEFIRTRNLMYSMSKLGYLMVFLVSLPISLEVRYILRIWLGDNIPDNTPIFIILVLINMAIGSLNLPVSQTVQAVGNIRKYQTIRSVVIMSALPLSWIFLATGFPAYFVFVILITVNIINQPISLYLLKQIFDYPYKEYLRNVIFPCFIFSLVTPILPLIIHNVANESFGRLIAVITVSIITTFVFAYLIVLQKEERILVKGLITRILHRYCNFTLL